MAIDLGKIDVVRETGDHQTLPDALLLETDLVDHWVKPLALSATVLLLLLTLTWGGWLIAKNNASHYLNSTFDFRVRDLIVRINQRMNTYEQVLRGVQGLMRASDQVTREEFADYIDSLQLDANFPGIQGVGIAEIVHDADKDQHIAHMRSLGFPEYDIHPAGKRDVYVVITQMEPFKDKNQVVLGYDPYPKPMIKESMDKARDQDIATISGKMQLLQDKDEPESPAFIMYFPLYKKGAIHTNIAERQANIIGWVDAPFRMNDLMSGIGGERGNDLDVKIYDGDTISTQTLMYASKTPDKEPHAPLMRKLEHIEISGHRWTLIVSSLPKFEARVQKNEPRFIAITGTLFSLLLATLTWILATSRLRAINIARNMTENLRLSEERWKFALEGSGDAIWDWDTRSGEFFISKRWNEMLGYSDEHLGNGIEKWKKLVHVDDLEPTLQAMRDHMESKTPAFMHEYRSWSKDGSMKWILGRGMVMSRDADGKPLRILGTNTDITDRKASEMRIMELAQFDVLTGLPNRALLMDRLEQEIKKSKRTGLPLAVMFTDIDHFKEVNDTLGHQSGDNLLKEAAKRMLGCIRESDTVARFGGDEFTIILGDLEDISSVERVAKEILQKLAEPFNLDGELVYVSVSIGMTLYPTDADNIQALLKSADQAMYAAKNLGRNRYSYFTLYMQEAAQTRMRLTSDLRTALSLEQLFVVYQPIVELASGHIHKAEALVRWQHPTRGLVSPADFIPIAEETGLIIDIGQFVFEEAAKKVKLWRELYHPQFQISINKSPVQFYDTHENHADWFEYLASLGLPGQSITVEITEGLLMDASNTLIDKLLAFRDAGLQVSLDDFGTGYSSLSYLKKFDIDYLKIDQSFVRNLTAESEDFALCEAIIVMAHKLNIKVIAEGVETISQRDLLLTAGCDYAQGFLFSRPVKPEEFEKLLKTVW
jgi:diguanylate cyclase (GGDEF)-like protein/PAS domain S-box-containing protein